MKLRWVAFNQNNRHWIVYTDGRLDAVDDGRTPTWVWTWWRHVNPQVNIPR